MRFDSTILLLKDHLPEIGRLRLRDLHQPDWKQKPTPRFVTIPGQRGALLEFGFHLWIWCLFSPAKRCRRPLASWTSFERGTGTMGDRAGPDRERHAVRHGHRTRRSREGCEN